MKSLVAIIEDPARRGQLVHDVAHLIDARVSAVKGLSGVAIKGGYKIVSSMKQGRMIPGAVNYLLHDFCQALDPYVAKWQASNVDSFEAFICGQEREVTNALLSITDEKARHASPIVAKPYQKLRKFGESQVQDAVPGIAKVITKTIQA